MRMSFRGLMLAALSLSLATGLSAAQLDVKTSGFVDGYYQFNFNNLKPASQVYTVNQGQFDLEGAMLSVAVAGSTFGQVDLLSGQEANAFVTAPASGYGLGISQAFVGQTLGPIKAELGQMLTFIGKESIYQSSNSNFSRSLLFNQEPVFALGLRASYNVIDSLSIMAEADNGTNVNTTVTEGKAYGAQVAYTGSAASASLGWYMSDEDAGKPLHQSNTTYINFVGSYKVMDSLNLSAEYLYKTVLFAADAFGAGSPASSYQVQGYAVYADYASPVAGLSVSPRFEQVFSPELVTAANGLQDFQQSEVTVTVKYVAGQFTHFLEFRDDFTPNKVFLPSGKVSSASDMLDHQLLLTYGAMLSF